MNVTPQPKIYLIVDNSRIEIKRFVFNGGEVSVSVPVDEVKNASVVRIVAHIKNSDDLMTLLLVNDAVKRVNPSARRDASIPYIPYGRQDRVCNPGEAFSLKIACDLINSCEFAEVLTHDPHSDVTTALINNLAVCEQDNIVRQHWGMIKRDYADAVIVSPDAGSNKKILKVCQALGKTEFIRADKNRDVATGNIIETVVYADDLTGKDCLIVDDLCDGGMTFIKLAEALKAKGAGKVALFVTHGIFSKGLEPITAVIDNVFCCDSWL